MADSKPSISLTILLKDGTTKVLEFNTSDPIMIGSGASSHVKLDGDDVSSLHCMLKPRDGKVYVLDDHPERVAAAFGLDDDRGDRLDVQFIKDEHLIGPERTFERAWRQHPDRDVILLHTDMRPMPHDNDNSWYDSLLDWVDALPDAGAVACNLIYPSGPPGVEHEAGGAPVVQCAGGVYQSGKITHLGGAGHLVAPEYHQAREVDWVTFGGVYLRRAALDMCHEIDGRYEWAYVMDVDHSLEIRRRGLRLYQVPVQLEHHESLTASRILAATEYRSKVDRNFIEFERKWSPDWPRDQLLGGLARSTEVDRSV